MPISGCALMLPTPHTALPTCPAAEAPDSLPGPSLATSAAKGRAGTVLGLRPSPYHGHEAATETAGGCKMQVGQAQGRSNCWWRSAGPGLVNARTPLLAQSKKISLPLSLPLRYDLNLQREDFKRAKTDLSPLLELRNPAYED